MLSKAKEQVSVFCQQMGFDPDEFIEELLIPDTNMFEYTVKLDGHELINLKQVLNEVEKYKQIDNSVNIDDVQIYSEIVLDYEDVPTNQYYMIIPLSVDKFEDLFAKLLKDKVKSYEQYKKNITDNFISNMKFLGKETALEIINNHTFK